MNSETSSSPITPIRINKRNMPLYDYKCSNGHIFEEMQSFSSEPVATCAECGLTAVRQLSVPVVLYKGSGFYTTDYARNGSNNKDNGKSEKSESTPSSSKSDNSGSDSRDKSSSASANSSSASD